MPIRTPPHVGLFLGIKASNKVFVGGHLLPAEYGATFRESALVPGQFVNIRTCELTGRVTAIIDGVASGGVVSARVTIDGDLVVTDEVALHQGSLFGKICGPISRADTVSSRFKEHVVYVMQLHWSVLMEKFELRGVKKITESNTRYEEIEQAYAIYKTVANVEKEVRRPASPAHRIPVSTAAPVENAHCDRRSTFEDRDVVSGVVLSEWEGRFFAWCGPVHRTIMVNRLSSPSTLCCNVGDWIEGRIRKLPPHETQAATRCQFVFDSYKIIPPLHGLYSDCSKFTNAALIRCEDAYPIESMIFEDENVQAFGHPFFSEIFDRDHKVPKYCGDTVTLLVRRIRPTRRSAESVFVVDEFLWPQNHISYDQNSNSPTHEKALTPRHSNSMSRAHNDHVRRDSLDSSSESSPSSSDNLTRRNTEAIEEYGIVIRECYDGSLLVHTGLRTVVIRKDTYCTGVEFRPAKICGTTVRVVCVEVACFIQIEDDDYEQYCFEAKEYTWFPMYKLIAQPNAFHPRKVVQSSPRFFKILVQAIYDLQQDRYLVLSYDRDQRYIDIDIDNVKFVAYDPDRVVQCVVDRALYFIWVTCFYMHEYRETHWEVLEMEAVKRRKHNSVRMESFKREEIYQKKDMYPGIPRMHQENHEERAFGGVFSSDRPVKLKKRCPAKWQKDYGASFRNPQMDKLPPLVESIRDVSQRDAPPLDCDQNSSRDNMNNSLRVESIVGDSTLSARFGSDKPSFRTARELPPAKETSTKSISALDYAASFGAARLSSKITSDFLGTDVKHSNSRPPLQSLQKVQEISVPLVVASSDKEEIMSKWFSTTTYTGLVYHARDFSIWCTKPIKEKRNAHVIDGRMDAAESERFIGKWVSFEVVVASKVWATNIKLIDEPPTETRRKRGKTQIMLDVKYIKTRDHALIFEHVVLGRLELLQMDSPVVIEAGASCRVWCEYDNFGRTWKVSNRDLVEVLDEHYTPMKWGTEGIYTDSESEDEDNTARSNETETDKENITPTTSNDSPSISVQADVDDATCSDKNDQTHGDVTTNDIKERIADLDDVGEAPTWKQLIGRMISIPEVVDLASHELAAFFADL